MNKGGLGLHSSLLAGIIALSALILPYIVKTTELAFSSVPRTLREGAIALGMSRGKTIRKVLLPPALPGIVSGPVLALAISTGETAPMLFTAGFSDQNPQGLLQPVGYLTNVTYTDIQLPRLIDASGRLRRGRRHRAARAPADLHPPAGHAPVAAHDRGWTSNSV